MTGRAGMMSADCLILLSDVDGFYTAAPETDENADLIRLVTDVNDDLLSMAGCDNEGDSMKSSSSAWAVCLH